jgi:hypothetical protein
MGNPIHCYVLSGEKAMRPLKTTASLISLLIVMSSSSVSQLRNISEYSQDRINTDLTCFVLHDTVAAEFVWASEWTHMTVNANESKSAIFVWHFKDGSKAYSQQGEGIDAIGKSSGFLLTNKAANLEDIQRRKIQPLTRNNYPVKVELWIGEIEDSTGYKPEAMGDEACFNSQGIEYNTLYYFSNCRPDSK